MKKYFEQIQNKTPHERRAHAMQWAGGITMFAALVWVSTLGLRFATPSSELATDDSNQVASVVESDTGNATLIVATSTSSF
jgi:hypothetical protein